jgi:hypothetical protein
MARKTEADVERTEEQNDQLPGIGHEGRGEGDGDASTAVAETKAKLKSSRPSNTIGILKRKPAFGVVAAGAIGLVAANVVGVGEVAIAMAAAYAAYRALTA